jgi:uridine kinase
VRVIAVDGPSGAGKSTFATLVAAQLAVLEPNPAQLRTAPVHTDPPHTAGAEPAGSEVTMLAMDAIYPGWDGLEPAVLSLDSVLSELAAGRDGQYLGYDWVAGRPGPPRSVRHAPWLVVEGVGCGARRLADRVNVLVWMDADPGCRYRRAMARDGEGYRPHWSQWAGHERGHYAVEGTAERADIVIGVD